MKDVWIGWNAALANSIIVVLIICIWGLIR